MRGNPDKLATLHVDTGSIPALAGEPKRHVLPGIESGVYPRACGGTRLVNLIVAAGNGLSPRLRGNPVSCTGRSVPRWSIPALAGEPAAVPTRKGANAVYPRACGGTRAELREIQRKEGLSPRLRGNRVGCTSGPSRRGSIPALAGEPATLAAVAPAVTVYPRACGGTRCADVNPGLPKVYPRACGGTAV